MQRNVEASNCPRETSEFYIYGTCKGSGRNCIFVKLLCTKVKIHFHTLDGRTYVSAWLLSFSGCCSLFYFIFSFFNSSQQRLHLGFMVPSLICQMREQTCSLEELDPCHHMREKRTFVCVLLLLSYITFACPVGARTRGIFTMFDFFLGHIFSKPGRRKVSSTYPGNNLSGICPIFQ